MEDLWEPAVAGAGGAAVAWMTLKRAVRWARLRCDQALDAVTALPSPAKRNLAAVAGCGPRPAGRGRAPSGRPVQQVLDRRG